MKAPGGNGFMISYELWETESGNLMASFATKVEALAAVAEQVIRHGPSSVESVALVSVNDTDADGDFETLATGQELARLSIETRDVRRAS